MLSLVAHQAKNGATTRRIAGQTTQHRGRKTKAAEDGPAKKKKSSRRVLHDCGSQLERFTPRSSLFVLLRSRSFPPLLFIDGRKDVFSLGRRQLVKINGEMAVKVTASFYSEILRSHSTPRRRRLQIPSEFKKEQCHLLRGCMGCAEKDGILILTLYKSPKLPKADIKSFTRTRFVWL